MGTCHPHAGKRERAFSVGLHSSEQQLPSFVSQLLDEGDPMLAGADFYKPTEENRCVHSQLDAVCRKRSPGTIRFRDLEATRRAYHLRERSTIFPATAGLGAPEADRSGREDVIPSRRAR
jgi:hypothetical protein